MTATSNGRPAPSAAEALAAGIAHHQAGRLIEAEGCYRQLLETDPANADALHYLGLIAHQVGRNELAIELFDQVLASRPGYAEAWSNRGLALHDLGRYPEAIASYDNALSARPAFAEASFNRGNALQLMGRLPEALASYDAALTIQPAYWEVLGNRGNVLQKLNRYEEACASYENALALEPSFADAHWNLGLCRLTCGDFANGWPEIEWRWKMREFHAHRRDFSQPLWIGGRPIAGKTVLLHAEQGLGDTLQFCRYAPMVAALGATVLLEVQGALRPLLGELGGVSRLLAQGEALPAFDLHCPLLSLPLAFGTTVAGIPAQIPYVHADAALVAQWRARLGEKRGLRIGIAWSATRATAYGLARSIPLVEFVKIIPLGAQCVSLQKDLDDEERAVIEARTDILHFGTGFADTAALVESMDLVVSVDTSIAHLAGAMGKAVWIMMPRAGDWRWMRDREDSPWYPSARLYRQPAAGDWDRVVKRVGEDLARLPLQ